MKTNNKNNVNARWLLRKLATVASKISHY